MKIVVHNWKGSANARVPLGNLGADIVQVWLTDLTDCAVELSVDRELLSEAERARADRFLVAHARNAFVIGRALLRRILGSLLNLDPTEVSFDYGIRGKPRLSAGSGPLDLQFNLAHSHSLLAIALARGREVGIDIEWIDEALRWPELAEQVFSESELRALRCLPASQQRLAFFSGWTRKEAFLKATGEGLIDAISTLEVTVCTDLPPRLLRLPTASRGSLSWDLHEIPLPAGYCGALVVADRLS